MYDYHSFNRYAVAFTYFKIRNLIQALVSFGILSMINGLLIRLALIMSNEILIPIMVVAGWFRQMNDDGRMAIYHSIGLIGAHLAHLDR